MDGIIVVNKEQDYTSFDVVAKLRGILKQKKMGHTGTLDPMATGVLPVCLGAGTKLCDMMTDSKKIYRVKMLLGSDYDTEDVTGELLAQADVPCNPETEELIRQTVREFTGELMQLPPMYSAVKVNGKKLCDYARAGKEVERKPRKVTIYDIEIEGMHLPVVTMKVTCSKGTYIRTLCREIGEKLGFHGCMQSLVRIYTGGFDIKEARTIDEIIRYRDEGRLEELLYGVDSFFEDYPAAVIAKDSELYADNGNPMMENEFAQLPDFTEKKAKHEDIYIRLYRSDRWFYGVYRYDYKRNLFVPEKMFFCQGREE
ncbi:MAG: tRNA pseudouridine(55) synthase TruB [Lachnospiraceae bacterium]|nr:tRNA pseudouridine(55) synthase TruB [Lachnospiraceae bacterium]